MELTRKLLYPIFIIFILLLNFSAAQADNQIQEKYLEQGAAVENGASAFESPSKSLLTEDTLDTINHVIPAISIKKSDQDLQKLTLNHGKSLAAIDKVIEVPKKNSQGFMEQDKKETKGSAPTLAKSDHLDLFIEENKKTDADSVISHLIEDGYKALKLGQSEVATMLFEQVLQESPDNHYALFSLATIYQNSGQTDEARKLYTHLLSIDPSNQQALNNFLVLVGENAPEDAILELKKAGSN